MPEAIFIFGNRISLYTILPIIALVVFLIAGNLLGKKYKFGYFKSIAYVFLTVLIRILLLNVTSWLFCGGTMGSVDHVRTVIYIPILLFPITLIFRDKFAKVLDFIAPLLALYHAIICLGCMFAGCCQGYPAAWGIYSNVAETICFPIQPIEAATNAMISMVLLIMTNRKIQAGRLYAWYLVLYGGTRFFFEFFRNNHKVWCGLSEFSFQALVAVLMGMVCLIITNKYFRERKEFTDGAE